MAETSLVITNDDLLITSTTFWHATLLKPYRRAVRAKATTVRVYNRWLQ